MQFRYVAFWFYLLQFVLGVAMFVYVGTGIIVGLGTVVPSLKMVPWLFYIVALFLTLCAAYPVFVFILRMHGRFQRFYPARPLPLTKEGISFDLPLGLTAFVAWRDISSIQEGIRLQATWQLVIEFKHKLSFGPAGLELKLNRLVLNGYRILPSGGEFLKAAQHYHAQASGRPEAAEQRGEPRQSILRKLAWTFRRPAR
jgi:hypothetical protein